MAAIASSIVTPSSSLSTSLPRLPSDHFHQFTHYSPKPTRHLLKTLTFKTHNVTTLPLPLHLCHCVSSSALDDIESATSGESERNPDDGRIYVGNLDFNVTSSELSEIFSRAGQIKSVEIRHDKLTDKSRGFGYVTMESLDEAKEAIRMYDGSEVGGRKMRVNFPERQRGGQRKMTAAKVRISNQSFIDTPHKVYAGNLGWKVTSQSLQDAFADQTGFLSAKVIYERERGRSRGFGFVTFESAEGAQSAISALDGVELEGRPIRLNMATDKSRSTTAETTPEQSEVLSAINS